MSDTTSPTTTAEPAEPVEGEVIAEQPRLGWHAGAHGGPIRTSEGLATITLDGRSLLGVDLRSGVVGMWPDDERGEWVRIGEFDPTPLPPSLVRRPPAGYEPLLAAAGALAAARDEWQEASYGDSNDAEHEAAFDMASLVDGLLTVIVGMAAQGASVVLPGTWEEVDALEALSPPSLQALFRVDSESPAPGGRTHPPTMTFLGDVQAVRELLERVVANAAEPEGGEAVAVRGLSARLPRS